MSNNPYADRLAEAVRAYLRTVLLDDDDPEYLEKRLDAQSLLTAALVAYDAAKEPTR